MNDTLVGVDHGVTSSSDIHSQTDADIKLANCSTVAGDLYISSDFPGSLNISTITNITGSIYIEASEITSITLDNLLYLDQLYVFSDAYNLTSLSAAQLSKINDLSITSELPIIINAPALVNTTDIRHTGNFSR